MSPQYPDDVAVPDVFHLISDIKHGKIFTSYDIALRAEQMLERLISDGKWKNAQELMQQIKFQIQQMADALLPVETTATNIMRHILKLIREEHTLGSEKKDEGQSLHQLVTAQANDVLDYSKPLEDLKSRLLNHLTEYKEELSSSAENIAMQALEHIHSNEIILTVGNSSTVERFLKCAGKKRSFQVIVVEGGAPLNYDNKMAAALAKSGIQTTVIADSAVFAMMSRVNKVIIGTRSILADGGLGAASGSHCVALAAKHYSVPVVVLAHMYKLTPVYVCSHEKEAFNVLASPASVIPYSSGPVLNNIEVYNPIFDYVPPELVTLFISHQGGNSPSYVYRLLSELYHQDDYE